MVSVRSRELAYMASYDVESRAWQDVAWFDRHVLGKKE